jgi:hypothetical protein
MAKQTVTVDGLQIFQSADGSIRIVDKATGKITNVQKGDRQFSVFEEMFRNRQGQSVPAGDD